MAGSSDRTSVDDRFRGRSLVENRDSLASCRRGGDSARGDPRPGTVPTAAAAIESGRRGVRMRPILFVVPGPGPPDPQLWRVDLRGLCLRAGDGRLACASGEGRVRRRLRAGHLAVPRRRDRCAALLLHPASRGLPSTGDLFRTWEGGNVFYGCILGGLTGSILYWFRRPFPFLRMCDAAAPAVAIGAAVGRIGCFLNGCCHGAVCDLPWAVRFPAGSHAWVRQLNAGLIATRGRALPAGPSDAALFGRGRVCSCSACCWLYARRRSASGRGHGPADDRSTR